MALGLVLVAGCVALVWSRLDSVAAGLTSWGGSSSTTPASPEEAPPLLEMTEDMREVLLFFPRADGLGLGVEPSEVFDLNNPSARGKLVLERLAAGPGSDTLGLALPQEALVRELWISPSGTAYVDFSRQLGRNHPGGTTGEMLTVYAIINSLVYNLPEVRKVQILMEGREVDTLAGHLALWLPLGADLSLVVSETDRPSSNPPRAAATF